MLKKWISILSVLFFVAGIIYFLQATEKKQIKVIVFDFGGVIAKTDAQKLANFVAQNLHISESEALTTLKQMKKQTENAQQEIDFWIAYANTKKIKLPDHWQEKLDQAKLEATQAIPGMIELVKELQKQGYQTALLSNIRKSHADIKRKLGYYDLFNPALLSYEIGVRKPDIQAYEILLGKLQVPPRAVLFVDNQEINVETAKSLGMDGIVFINKDQFAQELKKRGIKVAF